MLGFTEYANIIIGLFAICGPIGFTFVIILFTSYMTALKCAKVGHITLPAICIILLTALFN